MEKSNELELELFSKANIDSMGSFTLYFVQPDGGIGNKAIRLGFESIMSIGNNGFILYGNGKISGKKISRANILMTSGKSKYSMMQILRHILGLTDIGSPTKSIFV